MSRHHNREERINERLQEENRKLKAENRHLLKKLKQLSRGYYKFLYSDTHEEEQEAVKEAKAVAKKICFDCRVGELQLSIIGSRYWRYCNNCDKRTKTQSTDNLSKEELKKYNENH